MGGVKILVTVKFKDEGGVGEPHSAKSFSWLIRIVLWPDEHRVMSGKLFFVTMYFLSSHVLEQVVDSVSHL